MEQSKKISRKVISVVLSLLMVLSCFSGMSLTAYAADTTITWDSSVINSITIKEVNGSYNNSGITVQMTATGMMGGFQNKEMYSFGTATFVFSSTVGNIKGITINADKIGPSPYDGWTKGSTTVTWSGTPASSVTLIGNPISIRDISSIVFTIEGANVDVAGVTLSPENSGTVEVVEDGDNWKFTATPASGYEFDCWKANDDGDFDTVSDNNPFIIDKSSFTTMSNFTAVFKEAAQTETLLTTITATGDRQASYSTANVATVSFSYTAGGSSAYLANWGWWGYGWIATVTPADGYTITKCVFYDDANRTATDSSSPFVVETTEGDKTPRINGTPIDGGNYQSKGIKKIEVYGYQTPSSSYADYLPAATDDATALAAKVVKFNGYDWYLIEDNSTSETEGTVTLFAKDTIGSSRFDNSKTVYSGSMVKSYLDNLTAEGGAFADVADAIVSTDLEDVTVTGAKLWLLSKDEVITTYKLSTALNKCSNDWWLRTPADSSYVIFVNGESGSVNNVGNSCMNTYGVRPALNLDLSKVEFNSETKTFALPQPLVEYPLWVGGVKVTSENMSGEGWNYAADTNTLTLNGYTNSGTARADIQSGVNNAAIYYNDNMSSPNPLTIQLAEGTTNSLTMTGDRVYGIYVFGSALTITGNGTLNVQSDDMAINDAWGVAITGGTVNAASSAYYGIGRVNIGADISSVTITGELGAIYGGSNEEQELINAVAGTGWTDVAGTTGQAVIATSTTGQNVSSYKKVYFTPHTHNFTYSASGATITATCTADGCTLDDGTEQHNHAAFITLNAPESLTYDGSGKPVTVTFSNNFESLLPVFIDDPEITLDTIRGNICYYKNGDKTAEPSEDAIAIAGTHTAELSFKGQTAGVTYTIAKADPTCTAPTGLTATYGQTLADVTLTNPSGNTAGTWAWADSRTSVGNVVTPAATFKASFVPTDTTNYNTVTNIDVTVTVGKANITPTVSIEGWTYGQEANAPSVSGNSGNGTVTYTYATKGSDNFSATVPTNAGNYTVKATIAATANYNGGTATADFTIAKADIAPTVSIEGWTYGDEANKPVLEGNTGKGVVTYLYKEKGASDMSCIEETPTQAGEYTVKAIIDETDNYNAGSATADFTIAKLKVTITAEDKTSKREAALKELICKVDGKILDSDDLGIKVTTNAKAAVAGKYVIKVAYTENANYDVTVVNGTYTVTDRITANERTKGKNKINSAIKATVNKDGSITAKWGAVANADKFEIYANYCSKDNEFKKIKTVKGNVHSFDITKLGGKKLDQKKSVKIYVVAYRKVNGKYEKITQSVQLHVVNQSKNYSNAKAITVKKDAFTLKVNKTGTIKPTLVLKNSKKKAVEHVAKFRYQSTNTAVATVDKNDKITAVGKGTCTIYIFANNGKLKSVKVTVK